MSESLPSEHPQADDIRRPPPEGDEQSGQATFAHEIASKRCQRARRTEWVDTLPALYRSEGFFEDLPGAPAPAPPVLRVLRLGQPASRPVWAGVLVHALGLRRT